MEFMGVRQWRNYQEDDNEHQMNMLPFSSSNNSSSSSSSPSSSSASHHYNRRPIPLTTDGSRWEYSPLNNETQQQQRFPWAWPSADKRGDEDVEKTELIFEDEEEEISATKCSRIYEGGAGAAAVRSRGVDNWAEEGICSSVEREHMFDKVVTPSDVGKLNRLVIPKQHAEKYFPLDSTNDKGLLLNFEDRSGKPWRFRYSYWNSSQSYVMTKGWSRFVKDKRLDAGDLVSFHRGVGEAGKDRLYIEWRRRIPQEQANAAAAGSFFSALSLPPPHHFASMPPRPSSHHHHHHHLSSIPLYWRPPPPAATWPWWDHHAQPQTAADCSSSVVISTGGHHNYSQKILGRHHRNSSYGSGSYGCDDVAISPLVCRQLRSTTTPMPTPPQQQQQQQQRQQQQVGQEEEEEEEEGDHHQGGAADEPMALESSVPVVVQQGKAASALKRLRLFGVNMDCPIPQSDSGV